MSKIKIILWRGLPAFIGALIFYFVLPPSYRIIVGTEAGRGGLIFERGGFRFRWLA
jgi:hypothetical protein